MSYHKDFYEPEPPRNCREPVSPAEDFAQPTSIYGYPAADLEFAAGLLKEAGLTPDDLRKCVGNIEYAVELVQQDVRRAMDKVVAEYAAKMLGGPEWKQNP